MGKEWGELSPDEKQEALFQRWLSPKDPQGNDLKFQSPQAERSYKERLTRIKDAIQLKKRTGCRSYHFLACFLPSMRG
jgi:hypothetical protein